MVWHIKKSSMMGVGVGTVYYKGDNHWTESYADRSTYTSQAKQKQRIIFGKKIQPQVGMLPLLTKANVYFFFYSLTVC